MEGGEINDGGMRGDADRRIPFLLGVWAGVEGGNQTAEGEREKGGNSLPFDGGEKRKRSRAFFIFRLLPPTLLRAQSRCPPLPIRLEHWFAHHAGIKGGGRRYEEAGGLFPRAFNLLEDFVVSPHLVLSSLARAGGTIPPQPTAEVKVAGWGAKGNVPPARFLLFSPLPFPFPGCWFLAPRGLERTRALCCFPFVCAWEWYTWHFKTLFLSLCLANNDVVTRALSAPLYFYHTARK